MSIMMQYYVTFQRESHSTEVLNYTAAKLWNLGLRAVWPQARVPQMWYWWISSEKPHTSYRGILLYTYNGPPKICPVLTPEPLNMPLFGKRVFEVVIKVLELGSSGAREGPKSHNRCPYKRKADRDVRHRDTQEGDMKTEVQSALMHLKLRNTKDCQWLPKARSEPQNRFFLRASRMKNPADILILSFQPLGLWENKSLWF